MNGLPFRQAGPGDQTELLGLIREYYAFDSIPFAEQDMASGLEVLLHAPLLGRALLIEDQGRTVGYLILTFGFDLEFGGRQATLTDLFLRPEARGLGLGSAVLVALEQLCLTLGVTALELQVERENIAAQAFYQQLGFESHDRIPMSKRLRRQNTSSTLPPEVPT